MLSSSSLSFIFVAGALAAAPAAPAAGTQDLFAPDFPIVAYQLAAGADATTYLVGCTAGSDTKTCNFAQPYTLVQGPNTAQFTMSIPGQGAATVGCDLADKTSMACVATGGAAKVPASIVTAKTTVTGTAAETHFRAVSMVTATANMLTYPTPSTTSHSTTHSTTSHNTTTKTTSSYQTSSANSTTAYPTSAPPTGTAPSSTTPAASTSATTIPNAGMLGASANLGGVIGVVVAVGAFFFAGAL